MITAWRLLSLIALDLPAYPGTAEQGAGGGYHWPVVAASQGIGLELWVRLLGLLLLLLGLFAGFAWAVKKWRLLPQLRGSRQQRLQILETRPLGQRNSLLVIGYGEQRFLIGASNAGIQLLSQLPGSKEPNKNQGGDKDSADKEDASGFLADLNRHIDKEEG